MKMRFLITRDIKLTSVVEAIDSTEAKQKANLLFNKVKNSITEPAVSKTLELYGFEEAIPEGIAEVELPKKEEAKPVDQELNPEDIPF